MKKAFFTSISCPVIVMGLILTTLSVHTSYIPLPFLPFILFSFFVSIFVISLFYLRGRRKYIVLFLGMVTYFIILQGLYALTTSLVLGTPYIIFLEHLPNNFFRFHTTIRFVTLFIIPPFFLLLHAIYLHKKHNKKEVSTSTPMSPSP